MPDSRPTTGPGSVRGAVAVIAKTPVAGRVKTRLCPPLSTDQACEVAWACLLDTLAAAASVPSRRHVLLLDGEAGPWVPRRFEVIPQRGGGLGDRLSAGFADIDDDTIIIAMDTPQVDPAVLAGALGALGGGVDSVIGSADDGGYWIIGLRRSIAPHAVFADIPMSTPETGRLQVERLSALGLSIFEVAPLRDLDTIEDLAAIATAAPMSRVAALAFS
jgi:uncharacterized protein